MYFPGDVSLDEARLKFQINLNESNNVTTTLTLSGREHVYQEVRTRSMGVFLLSVLVGSIWGWFLRYLSIPLFLVGVVSVWNLPCIGAIINQLPRGSAEFQRRYWLEPLKNYSLLVCVGLGFSSAIFTCNVVEMIFKYLTEVDMSHWPTAKLIIFLGFVGASCGFDSTRWWIRGIRIMELLVKAAIQ